MSGVGNQYLDYVDIDHSANPGPWSVGVIPRSEGVIYAEIQQKRKNTDTDHQVDDGETLGDSDIIYLLLLLNIYNAPSIWVKHLLKGATVVHI